MNGFKKGLLSLAAAACVGSAIAQTTPTITGYKVAIRANPVSERVYTMNGRIMVPLSVYEQMGVKVINVDADTVEIRRTNDAGVIQQTVQLYFNTNRVLVNGEQVKPEVMPVRMNGQVLVPARFMSESLNMYVFFDNNLKTVFLRES